MQPATNTAMKAVIQRVLSSSVSIAAETTATIDRGLMALVGFAATDDSGRIDALLEKIITLRIFSDDKGRFAYSVEDIDGELLLIPQFTLLADTSKGRRPDFFNALAPAQASLLFDELIKKAANRLPGKISSGIFGADMQVSLVNNGPVTILLEV